MASGSESSRLAGSHIHVAGNSVVDVLLPNALGVDGPAKDGWTPGNVHFLDASPECVMGGNGGSVAYLLGRLGNRVSLNTRVGADVYGTKLSDWFGEACVDLMGPPALRTAVNTILFGDDGARRSYYYTGEKVDWGVSLEAECVDWLYASGYGQVTSGDLETLTGIFRKVRAAGACVVFDPGPWFVQVASTAQMLAAWRQTDCLIGTEAELVTRRSEEDIETQISGLLNDGATRVVIKRGGQGAAFGEAGGPTGVLKVTPIEARNTVGAGDSFNAGVIHHLCAGESLEVAVGAGLEMAGRAVRSGLGALGALGEQDTD